MFGVLQNGNCRNVDDRGRIRREDQPSRAPDRIHRLLISGDILSRLHSDHDRRASHRRRRTKIEVVCPRPNTALLSAAAILGIKRIARIGGAQAIAALAYGTSRFLASKNFSDGQ